MWNKKNYKNYLNLINFLFLSSKNSANLMLHKNISVTGIKSLSSPVAGKYNYIVYTNLITLMSYFYIIHTSTKQNKKYRKSPVISKYLRSFFISMWATIEKYNSIGGGTSRVNLLKYLYMYYLYGSGVLFSYYS